MPAVSCGRGDPQPVIPSPTATAVDLRRGSWLDPFGTRWPGRSQGLVCCAGVGRLPDGYPAHPSLDDIKRAVAEIPCGCRWRTIPDASKSPVIGECIYCGGATADLADEHSIPFALFGTAILSKASCRSSATQNAAC